MFAYVLIPNLAVQVEQRRNPLLSSLIIEDSSKAGVFAASSDVLERGVEPGMTLHRARQRAPRAQVIDADELVYHVPHDGAFEVLEVFSEHIETVALGEFLLEWKFGPAQADILLSSLRELTGLRVQIGIAAHRFTAEQAAHRLVDSSISTIPKDEEALFLASLSVMDLPNVPREIVSRLFDLGIRWLGELVRMRRAAFVHQFGANYALYYDMARGCDPRPLRPDVPPLRFMREHRFDEPIEQIGGVVRAARSLSRTLGGILMQRGYQAETLKLVITFASGQKSEITHECKPPTADEKRLAWSITQIIEALVLREPITHLALIAYPMRPEYLSLEQLSLFESEQQIKRQRIEESARRIRRRYGDRILTTASLLSPPPPVPVKVQTDPQGRPSALFAERIAAIEEYWIEESDWWGNPKRRDYYRVVMADGSIYNLFVENRAWHIDRAWHALAS